MAVDAVMSFTAFHKYRKYQKTINYLWILIAGRIKALPASFLLFLTAHLPIQDVSAGVERHCGDPHYT
jgi:hypothetical protein